MSLLGFFAEEFRRYAYCPTGEGGGIDNSCPPSGGNGGGSTGPHHETLSAVMHGVSTGRIDMTKAKGLFEHAVKVSHSGTEAQKKEVLMDIMHAVRFGSVHFKDMGLFGSVVKALK